MKEIIKLQSRGASNFLRIISDKTYKLVTQFPTVRVQYINGGKEILSIDPSGGPMIQVGSKIEERVVKAVFYSPKHHGYIIKFA